MNNYTKIYEEWCTNQAFSDAIRKELIELKDEEEIKDRFYKELSFGTGGLRGVLGAGTNRMNIYTVTKATQGIANYIKNLNGQNKGVAIAYDSRNMSKEFAEATALCFNANGIKTYIFDSLRPTPILSFAVRELSCIAGIVITASHNPKEYNGYKVYWEDGGQITSPRDKEIIQYVNDITDYASIKRISNSEAVRKDLYHVIDDNIDDKYIQEIQNLVINTESIRQNASKIKIVYTPLHGAGNKLSQRILKELGFTNIYVVKEQEEPNGDFPTVQYPNPEDPDAFKLALNLANNIKADIVLATDPDADRLGVYLKDNNDKYRLLSGNMSGALLGEYILSQKKEKGLLPNDPYQGVLLSTIVSTNLAKEIANEYNISFMEVLTGFKYIGEKIREFEENQYDTEYEYLYGFEESFGCLVGTYTRDKDAISAIAMLCEAAAYYNGKGINLWSQMVNIYNKYGYFRESLTSVTLKGIDGINKIKKIMDYLRVSDLSKVGNYDVLLKKDYKEGVIYDFKNHKKQSTKLPISNVLYFELQDKAWCCIRPSGTEPKIKFYVGIKGDSFEDSDKKLIQLKEDLLALINDIA